MAEPPRITNLRFTAASRRQHRAGLLGWLSFNLDGTLRLDGVTLRRTMAGRLALSFPERTDSSGQQHPIIRPLDNNARRRLEQAVIAALPFGMEVPS